MTDLLNELAFYFQRLNWLSIVDLLLVTAIAFFILRLVQGTQAIVLLRGMILFIIVTTLLTVLRGLPAFSWLLTTTLPALLVAVPVIFAPEIRRALERLGRAGSLLSLSAGSNHTERMIDVLSGTVQRLADRRYGSLIVVEREVHLDEYIETGVKLDAQLTPELLLQIFFINTPLHDGAVILREDRIIAAACILPLSASGTLSRSPERKMGLRHRAALGISEVSDSVAIVVSEETGDISIAHNGRIIRRLDQNRMRNIMTAMLPRRTVRGLPAWFERIPFERIRLRRQAPGD
ncbi:MAG: diadenylate cyclase CdaA [Anaerolineaceae bacterium]|nr:MAG: diadenylate cyclase CdaA [Anaerolineaceae bacterium]